jgi:hypothetical protein
MKDDEKVTNDAVCWVRDNRGAIIEKFASLKEYEADRVPTSVFMAGSLGAGKTEVSKRIVEAKKPLGLMLTRFGFFARTTRGRMRTYSSSQSVRVFIFCLSMFLNRD